MHSHLVFLVIFVGLILRNSCLMSGCRFPNEVSFAFPFLDHENFNAQDRHLMAMDQHTTDYNQSSLGPS